MNTITLASGATVTVPARHNATVTVSPIPRATVTVATVPRATVDMIMIPGPEGPPGPEGDPGVGVPVGGTTGQVLAKIDATNYNTQWIPAAAGGVTDGDKGDIVVASSGASWLFDTSVVTAAAKTVLDDASTAAMLTTLGAQPVDADLTTIAGLTATTNNMIQSVGSAWASRTPAQVKSALSLDLVSNTADADKPVSTATQTALNLKADKSRTVTGYSGTSLTAVIGDADAYVRCTGTNPTYTIPPNATVAFPTGTQIDGVGTATAMTLVAGGGVTINKARTLVTVAADSGWTAIKVATNEWDVHGDFV